MIPVPPSLPPPEIPGNEGRRREIRNYGVSLLACLAGVALGALVQRGGWGGQAGAIFGFLSGALAVFCAGMLVRGWRAGGRR